MSVEHAPRRGDDVEQWLRRQRDSQPERREAWLLLDDLLDDYRLHADTGTPLYADVEQE